jgi:hypothetical protein
MKKIMIYLIVLSLASIVLPSVVSAADKCAVCHKKNTPGIVKQWEDSKHSKEGVECLTCHKAKEGDPSGFNHNGEKITAVVSPKYLRRLS